MPVGEEEDKGSWRAAVARPGARTLRGCGGGGPRKNWANRRSMIPGRLQFKMIGGQVEGVSFFGVGNDDVAPA